MSNFSHSSAVEEGFSRPVVVTILTTEESTN